MLRNTDVHAHPLRTGGTKKNVIYLVLHAIDRFGHRIISDQVRVGEVSINLSLRRGGVVLRQHLRNNAETDRDIVRRFGPYQRRQCGNVFQHRET